jgi:hypothetical protein
MKIARKYESGVEFHQAYIDIILRFAGYRLSDLYTSILAYSSYHGDLTKEVKDEIARKNNTSVQVISNGITRLRKLKVLEKNKVTPKILPPNTDEISLTLVLGIVKEKSKQENQPSV